MMRRTVHQVLVGAARNDAITTMAIGIQAELASKFSVSTYSYHNPDESVASLVRPLDEMPEGSSDDVILYHLSFGVPDLIESLLKRPEKLVVCYHNITPAHFYEALLPDFAAALRNGREEMRQLAAHSLLSVADSDFNAEELREAGHRNVRVLAAGMDPHRLSTTPIDSQFLGELEENFPHGFVLFVSQVLPHKRVDHALAVIHLLRTVHSIEVGLVVAGPIRQPAYVNAVNEFRTRLVGANALLTDSVSESQLATLYRACRCFVGTSQHEGLSVPPLEAMAEGAPVVVRGSGAVTETVGEGGLVLRGDCGILELTEAVAIVLESPTIAARLRMSGRNRLHSGATAHRDDSILDLIEAVAG